MNPLNKIKNWLHRKKRLRAALYNIRHDPSPKTRPEAVYEFLSIKLEDVTRKRPLTTGEFEILSAMIVGNALAGYPNRKHRIESFKNIERGAPSLRLCGVGAILGLVYTNEKLPPLWYSKLARWLSARAWLWWAILYFLFFFVWPFVYDESLDPGADIMIDDVIYLESPASEHTDTDD